VNHVPCSFANQPRWSPKKKPQLCTSNAKTTRLLKNDWATKKRLNNNCTVCNSGCKMVTHARLEHHPRWREQYLSFGRIHIFKEQTCSRATWPHSRILVVYRATGFSTATNVQLICVHISNRFPPQSRFHCRDDKLMIHEVYWSHSQLLHSQVDNTTEKRLRLGTL
jgi:hypothetical protein